MDTRFKPKRVADTTVAKLSKRELIVRPKTFGNQRSFAEKKSALPPLTPLHRLRRFQAIRDRNLKKVNKAPQNRLKMAETENNSQDAVVESVQKEPESNHPVCVIRKSPQKNILSEEKEAEGIVSNGQNGHSSEPSNDEPTEGGICLKEQNGVSKEENSKINSDITSSEDIVVDDNFQLTLDAEDDLSVGKESVGEAAKEVEEDKESDRASSVSSSSTFISNHELHSSTDDILSIDEALQNKAETDSDVEIDVDKTSCTDDEKASAALKRLEEVKKIESKELKEAESEEVKVKEPPPPPSRIPRSVGSASSYKTAYGSLNRISGRRAVITRSRKRKAEELSDRGSPSQPSPRWRFFQSSVSRLWTPSSLSVPHTPLRPFEDSMAVNVDEDTIRSHLNDSELFFDSSSSQPPSKKSRWGCVVM